MEINLKKRLNAAEGEMLLDVQLALADKQLVGLYGISGAGKTSLLRMLAGLFKPDEARIVFNDQVWVDTQKKINLSPQKRRVGLVFQDYALFPNMTVRENLSFALGPGQAADVVEELIELSELGTLQHQLPGKLSGGQQQRVALARALVQRPQLLLLDEPLSALDSAMREKLQQYLLRIHEAYGLTTILISHTREEIEKMADWVVVLDEGKVKQQGKVSEIFPEEQSEQTITLIGTLQTIEQANGGRWLTIVDGENKWRIWLPEEKYSDYKQGDRLQVDMSAKEPGIKKY